MVGVSAERCCGRSQAFSGLHTRALKIPFCFQMCSQMFSLCSGEEKRENWWVPRGGSLHLCVGAPPCAVSMGSVSSVCSSAQCTGVHWRSGLAVLLRSKAESFWRSSLLHSLPAGSQPHQRLRTFVKFLTLQLCGCCIGSPHRRLGEE